MMINSGTKLKITENLLLLERGRDEFLLTDYVDLQPLYVRKGKRYIKDFLKSVTDLKTYGNIMKVFPHEGELLNTLMHHGIVVPHSFRRSTEQNYSTEGPDLQNKTTMSLYLLISQSCNMGCVYCLNGKKTYHTDKTLMMDKEIAFRSIERCVADIAPGGRLEVVFFGGEPMLNWPLAKETITYCENSLKTADPEKEIRYHFTSNLSLLPVDLIEWSKRFNITFLCDLDGPADIHDVCRPFKNGGPTHETIIGNIRRLIDAGLRVDLRATVTALNHDRLPEIAEHHKAVGGSSSAFIPVNPVNSDEDILLERLLPSPRKMASGMLEVYRSGVWKKRELYPFNLYEPRLRPRALTVLGCGLSCGNTPVVDANGDVFPCIYLVGIKRFYMGNIMKGSYPNRGLLNKLYSHLHVDRLEDCKLCPWRYMCGGGCPLWRLTVSANQAATQRTMDYCRGIACEYTRSIIEVLLWDKARESASHLMKSLTNSEAPNPVDVALCR
jgi:uncharacterized protein